MPYSPASSTQRCCRGRPNKEDPFPRVPRSELVLTPNNCVDESAWGMCPQRSCRPRSGVSRHGGRRSVRQLRDWWPTNLGRARGKEAPPRTRPIAPGKSAKSSAPLGHHYFREPFYFLDSVHLVSSALRRSELLVLHSAVLFLRLEAGGIVTKRPTRQVALRAARGPQHPPNCGPLD